MPLQSIALAQYYNRFDAADLYEEMLFLPRGLQSAEMNEIQGIFLDRLKKITDTIYSDGAVVSGALPIVDSETGAITCPESLIYVEGAIRSVPERSFTIPTVGIVQVGVYLLIEEITELEAPELRDPAISTKNYQEPGAARLKVTPQWAHDGEGLEPFYSVYTIVDGVLQGGAQEGSNAFIDLLARYDREANGGYIVRGMFLTALNANGAFQVSSGTGNVYGYKLDKFSDTRLNFPVDPDLEAVTSEPDNYVDDSTPIQLNRKPVQAINEVVAAAETTQVITRGGVAGGADGLAEVSVTEIIEVVQGGTTYVAGTDYFLNGDQVDWSPGGAEPAPGSTYSVTYRYLANFTPADIDLEAGTFTITGAVAGELVLTDYTWRVGREDRICLQQDGTFIRIKGQASRFQPVPPTVPETVLLIGTVSQRWSYTAKPEIINDASRTVTMREQGNIRELVVDLFDLVSRERLRRDIASREPTTKRGVFVDPMLDNDLRDEGREQDAQIVDGALRLPVRTSFMELEENTGDWWMLPYTEETVIAQTLETGSTKINPFQSVPLALTQPSPNASLTLTPAADHWAEAPANIRRFPSGLVTEATWDEFIVLLRQRGFTGTIAMGTIGDTGRSGRGSRRVTSAILNGTRVPLAGGGFGFDVVGQGETFFCRQLPVGFTVTGFGNLEGLESLEFDGADVTPVAPLAADASGNMTGTFIIPPGIPIGVKDVVAIGEAGSRADAVFTAGVTNNGQTVLRTFIDPVAQTFQLPEGRWVTSADVAFRATGDSSVPVQLQIRTVEVGLPTTTVVAQGSTPGTFATTGWTTIELDRPVWLERDTPYALTLLTEDPDHAVALAALGGTDLNTGAPVTQQSATGVLLKSANGATWSPFQTEDLTFRLNAAAFTATSRVVDFGHAFTHTPASITSAGGTATVTLAGHGFTTGDVKIVMGAAQAAYNGSHTITVTGTDTFTYPVAGTPASPATGTIRLGAGRTSDLLAVARVFSPATSTGIAFQLTLDDAAGTVIRFSPNEPVELDFRLVHGATFQAVLSGTSKVSPFLDTDPRLAFGELIETGTYITRAIPVAANDRVEINYDAEIPSAATVAVDVEANAPSSPSWLAVAQNSATPVEEQVIDVNHRVADFASAGTETRLRLTLAGTPAARPLVSNIRLATLTT